MIALTTIRLQVLLSGNAIGKGASALQYEVDLVLLPWQQADLCDVAQRHRRLINDQRRSRSRDLSRITPIVRIVARKMHHRIGIRNLINRSKGQLRSRVLTGRVHP